MSIAEFIQDNIFRPRVQKTGCLVVYDPDGHYQNLCNTLADEKLIVVDVSKSSIESRIAAIQGLRDVVEKQLTGMLVYIPKKAPQSDEEKQSDPFAPIAAAGSIFPEGDGDNFESICLKAKPDHATAIRAIFQQDTLPSFAVIDAIGGGLGGVGGYTVGRNVAGTNGGYVGAALGAAGGAVLCAETLKAQGYIQAK